MDDWATESIEWSVEEWLEKAGLSQYATGFMDNGYETPELCAKLTDDDLDAIGVTNRHHRKTLFSRAKTLLEAIAKSPQPSIEDSSSSVPLKPSSFPACKEPWAGVGVGVGSAPTYSEPWTGLESVKQNGVIIHPPGITTTNHGGVQRKSSGEKASKTKGPPLPKRRRPAASPTRDRELPRYPREDGGTKLTKLQLKLKIRDQLQKDRIILSEPPYYQEVRP